jgi:hypothetical protein
MSRLQDFRIRRARQRDVHRKLSDDNFELI